MRERADAAPGSPGSHSRTRIQPGNESDSDDDDLPPDERLDRLLGDADLLLRLQLSGYAESEWAPVAAEFGRYGFNVIMGWLYNGQIFDKVHEKTQRHLRRPEERFDEDAVSTLATDTVIAALDAFLERVLKTNTWNPNRGASLKTFFIGQCCFQFSNVYRSWYRAEKRLRKTHLVGDVTLLDMAKNASRGADVPLLQHTTAMETLGKLSTDKARLAVMLHSIGYTQAEIAVEIGVADEKAVENLVGYQRRRMGNPNTGKRAV